MYGLEIKQNLLSMGENVSPGQLYPTLQKLTSLGALVYREEERSGANRTYYTITQKGKHLLLQNLMGLFQLIESLMMKKSEFAFRRARELLQLKPGMAILDLSIPYMDYAKLELAASVVPTGRYIMQTRNDVHTKLIFERISSGAISDTLTTLKGKEEVSSLPPKSVDAVLVFFTLHEHDTEWVISEMKRLLKPEGLGLIVDFVNIENHVMMDVIAQLIPGHSQLGIDVEKTERKLKEVGLRILQKTTEDWITFLQIKA